MATDVFANQPVKRFTANLESVREVRLAFQGMFVLAQDYDILAVRLTEAEALLREWGESRNDPRILKFLRAQAVPGVVWENNVFNGPPPNGTSWQEFLEECHRTGVISGLTINATNPPTHGVLVCKHGLMIFNENSCVACNADKSIPTP